ncbi:LPP20 family lipoprotein [Helicobacter sp. 23-1044]
MRSLLVAVVFGLFVFSGCGTSNIATDNAEINAALDGAPEWVLGESSGLSASGSAKIKNGNISFAVTQAEADARNKLAGQISANVESKYRELNTSDSESVNQEAVQAIRISVSKVLAGSKATKKWISKTNDMWVLVEVKQLDTDLLKKNLMKADGVDKEAAKALAKSVDELIDGFKND